MLRDYLSFFRPIKREWIERRILALIGRAYQHVPFYRELLKAKGLTPGDFKSLEDYIEKFPRTSASVYRSLQQEEGPRWMIDDRYDLQRLVHDRSSGSSGVTVSVYKTPKENVHNAAKTLWHLTKGGLRPWHRTLAVVPPLQVVKRDSFLQVLGVFRRCTVHYMMELDHILHVIEHQKINAIYGQKSFIRLLAEAYAERHRKPPQLRLLMLGAERIDGATRELVFHTFNPKRYGELYGSTETGIIASKARGDYEVNYRSTFFCLTDPVCEGKLTCGSIAVTSLYLEAQPILMVELGDTVTVRDYDRLLDLRACIVSIDGRDNDYLLLQNGLRVSGATFYAALEYFPFVQQFRIEQNDVESCRILLRMTEDSLENKRQVEHALASFLAGKIRYEIEYVHTIPMDPNGKTKILLSNVQGPTSS